ncbi:MAG TPA: LysR family transcriptional regulator [Verrucomicrobiae bacterium]|nr:LysR family transcriptional regulator [Verrucomicrobiae bacterium]
MNPDRLNRPLDSRQLNAFVAVARTRSFTRAGKELFLSQSAVSHALKALEDEIGCPLFDRAGKQIQLSPAGEHLLHFAEKILSDMASARNALHRRSSWGRARVRVGTAAAGASWLLPRVIHAFRREFPDCSVCVKTGDTRECIEGLVANDIDLGLAITPGHAAAVDVKACFTDELLWVVPENHSWARAGTVLQAGFASQTFIFESATGGLFRLVEKFAEREQLVVTCHLEAGTPDAVKELVAASAGVTALPAWAVVKEVKDGSLATVAMGKRKLKRTWSLLRPQDRKSDLATEVFARLMMEALASNEPPAITASANASARSSPVAL